MSAGLDVPTRSRWTKPRLFWAGVLFGRGCEADEIARFHLVQSHASAVRDVCRYYGAAFALRLPGNLTIDVPTKLLPVLEAEGRRRGKTPEALASQIISECAADPTLLANVLDDQ